MQTMMEDFDKVCGLPRIHGAIDGTHILIFKPLIPCP